MLLGWQYIIADSDKLRLLSAYAPKYISKNIVARAGVALSLPWLESLAQGAPAKAMDPLSELPLRMAFMFMPNGVWPDHWTPPVDGVDYEITHHLKPIQAFKKDFLLLENLWNRNSIGRNGHWPKVPIWLSGGYVQRTTADDLDTGAVSADQFAAQRIGSLTPLPSIELGIDSPRMARSFRGQTGILRCRKSSGWRQRCARRSAGSIRESFRWSDAHRHIYVRRCAIESGLLVPFRSEGRVS